MGLAFLLDENQRGLLWRHIQRHNTKGLYPLDIVRLGDSPTLSLGTQDPDILLWAERENRIVISRDRRTLAKHLTNHTAAGHHCPGVFQVRESNPRDLLEFLVCATYASEPWEWVDRITYIP